MDELHDPAMTAMCQVALDLARRSTHCPSTQDELYQIGLIQIFKVWEAYPHVDDREKKKLAHAAIRSRIVDYWRHNKGKERSRRNYYVARASSLRWQELHPVADRVTEAMMKVVEDIAKGLPEYLMTVYSLRASGRTWEEIAKETGQSLRTVKSRGRELKDRFKEGLDKSQEK